MASPEISCHKTSGGVAIYRIPLPVFPHLSANVYLVAAGDYLALVDTGSGMAESSGQLRAGLEALRDAWGLAVTWSDLRRIVVTHAHVDHYGGLGLVRSLTDAPVAVHELDRSALTQHEERLALAGRSLDSYLCRAGVEDGRRAELMRMHGWSKGLFRSLPIETTLRDGDLLDGLMRVHHTPGHCPGQVCLQIDDVLLSADHVLPQSSLFLSAESIMPWTGLGHYLDALRKIAAVPGIRLALGGHDAPIEDLYGAVERIAAYQIQRVAQVHALCDEPQTVAELAARLYPTIGGYDALLALQKMGAYVEYLDQRGELMVANLDEVVADGSVAVRYVHTKWKM